MAFPNGLAGPSGNAWDVGPCCVADVDDVGFARALVADVPGREGDARQVGPDQPVHRRRLGR